MAKNGAVDPGLKAMVSSNYLHASDSKLTQRSPEFRGSLLMRRSVTDHFR